MTEPPGAAEVRVATGVLRAEANDWDEQSAEMGAVGIKVGGMEFGRLEAGLFQLMVGPYNEVISAVQARCNEGAKAMTEIGVTLRAVADAYEAEDQAGEHRLRNIY